MKLSKASPGVVVVLLVFFVVKTAHAVIPSALNYQGYLTDASVIPFDDPVTLTIYDVPSGGVALFSDARSITVDQGVFRSNVSF